MPSRILSSLALPIVQAPMAGVQGSALACAVMEAGGLGSLPCAMLGAEALQAELEILSARAAQLGRPWNLNFFCHTPPVPDAAREAAWRASLAPYYAEFGIDPAVEPPVANRAPYTAEVAARIAPFRPPVVSFHFGLPAADLVAQVKGWGGEVWSTATTVEEAVWLEAHGADAVIAQGLEAGGHRGHFLSDDLTRQMGTFALLPQVVQAVRVPVVAAGGIADAAGVAAARALGAAAVQVGTAYLLCHEATTTPLHRAALQSPRAAHTALTNLITGRPARGIVQRLMQERGPLGDAPAFPLAGTALGPLRTAAERAGQDGFSTLWAGQNTRGCRGVGAGEITRGLAEGIAV
ncbi:nitronate monooxygenase [uncultured Xylophilus sp.]|uniref:NAD(P)H-dependent flavin oxidoreductase n=1 Tax=uncultured Xylophilus sp. TaxID=296832 RepID=UPI0025FADC34|nr:nitronate monooxygenase [uncultured Xylophilus sp.]